MGFPGVQSLLLKGCTCPTTAEATWILLSKLTLHVNSPIIDPSNSRGKAYVLFVPYYYFYQKISFCRSMLMAESAVVNSQIMFRVIVLCLQDLL